MSIEYIYSVCLIVPAAYRDAANQLAEGLGWGPDNYAIALTGNGTDVTHYALSTCCDQQFADWLENPPPEAGDISDLMAALIVSIVPRTDDGQHGRDTFAANGLAVWQPPEGEA